MSHGARYRSWAYYPLTALSLWIGWGIRGNFGHEYGAMIPGALAAMAAVLLSGRRDWHGRIAYFAMFGALGWSFGGSISYMQVIAYTHSGHSPSVLYGFACLFVIGFLWAAMGGAGTALPAVADGPFLAGLFVPISRGFRPLVAAGRGHRALPRATWVRDLAGTTRLAGGASGRDRGRGGLGGATKARSSDIARPPPWPWAGGPGFVILVLLLGLRMTPPRGDNWAGCLGMTAGPPLVLPSDRPIARSRVLRSSLVSSEESASRPRRCSSWSR